MSNYFAKTKVKISQAFLAHSHDTEGCGGKWELRINTNVVFNITDLGFKTLTECPFLECETCGTLMISPGFEYHIYNQLVLQLIQSDRILENKELKFLRKYFGLTQKDMASQIGYRDVKSYTNKESKGLPSDKQALFKIACITRLQLGHKVKLGMIDIIQNRSASTGSGQKIPRTLNTKEILGSEYNSMLEDIKEDIRKAA